MTDDDDGDLSPGWDAIDDALDRIYPDVEPQHYGTLIRWRLGGPDPLDGISIYPRDDHWHYVTYGMSELYDKESDDAELSGWGFEFTFRLRRDPAEEQAPIWAANLLQNLARYVFSSGNPFAPGHHLDVNGPIAQDRPGTAMRAITFALDPELGSIDTPHGHLDFLQVVGLTLDEYAIIEQWDAARLLDLLSAHLPLLVTDLDRDSLTGDPAVAAAVEEGVRRDGSSTGSLFVEKASWRRDGTTVLTLGANVVERFARVLSARLPFGRGLAVDTASGGLLLRPDDEVTLSDAGEGYLEIGLPAPVVSELASALRPVAGTYRLDSTPLLAVEVLRTEIRDPDGTVVRTVG